MRTENLKCLPYLLCLIFILPAVFGYGQIRTSLHGGSGIEQLEASLSKKELLQEVKDSLDVLKRRAVASGNENLQARCLYDLMRIRDIRTEDTLYFRNSAFMDTILNNQNSSPMLKAQIYIMQAQRLYGFNHKYLKFNPAAYRTTNLAGNYAALTAPQRDSLISSDFNEAFKLVHFQGEASGFLWLSSNPDVFLFMPKFADIVLSEHVNLTANRYDDYYVESRQMTKWASLSSPEFRKRLDSLAASSGQKEVFRAYKRWLDFRKDDVPANMFIESLVRKYMFLSASADSADREAYIDYLVKSTASPYPLVRVHTVYQLCLLWNEEGKRYANLHDRYQFLTGKNFDKRYQYFPKKVLDLYEQNRSLIAQYPVLDKVLQLMSKQILSQGIKIEMESKFIPGQAIPIKAIYKNANTLFYRIVAANAADNGSTPLNLLRFKKPLGMDKFLLPLPNDHNSHAAYLKLPALPYGSYHLLFSHKPIETSSDSVYNISFQVTSIVTINTDERLYVLDRKTGQPLPGAMIRLFKKKLPTTEGFLIRVNHKGYTMIPQNKADSIVIAYKNDTLGQVFNVRTNSVYDDDNIYDKDTNDGLDDFFDDKLKMQIFTDRAIYRPGQTVHYKIIFLTKDPHTGNTILFNRQNVGGRFFSNRLSKWIKNNQALIKLKDPFGRKIDSAKAVINEFGSFAGAFILPKAAATGDWSINGDPDADNSNDGRFQVEEYKRPTIELGLEKQAKMLLPGQPFTIKLKLRSYTGAELGNIPVTYRLQRYGEIPERKNVYGYYREVTLLDLSGHTDRNGILVIPVDDSLLARYQFDRDHRYGYTYHISARATDLTGESSEIDERINISTQPVRIDINVAKTYDCHDIPPLNIKTTNEFEGNLGRPVNIKLYKVSDPDAIALKAVDQWYYNRSEWNNWFPPLAELEQQPDKVRALILDTMINTGLYEKFVVPREKVGAGFYELDAVCLDNESVTGKATYNFKLFDSYKGETPVEDIDYLPINSVKPGETISWYSSGKYDSHTIYQVLYETSGGRKAIKDIYQELNEKKGIRKWSYQVPSDATGYLLLTRLSVSENVLHQREQRVYLFRPSSEPPEIIVERYRKVMAPGAKETFTISIKTKNDNVAAELMTTMYDASLDKLEQHDWRLPQKDYDRLYLQTDWGYGLTSTLSAGSNGQNEPYPMLTMGRMYVPDNFTNGLTDKAPGLAVTDASGLNEVVVVGYGSERRSALTGSVSTVYIRGAASLQDYRQPLIVLDGVIYTGDLKNIAPSAITDAMVLKGADGSAIYGVAGGQGVLIISTKGPIILPGSEDPVIKVRKNFNETAFFFPQVHISPDGYYHFSFIMPETTTEWKWRLFAHTRNAQFAYLERKLQTQLNLMVQANVPRLLYQGDRLILQSRISNLDTIAVKGTISCRIENAVTGQDITAQLANVNTQSFKLDKKSANAASFELKVPQGLTDPLKLVISVSGGGASDAEERIVPILSTRVFTRQSVAVKFSSNSSFTLPAVKLPVHSLMYGIGISIQQKPQASLINALPWLANYSYDCGEQTFNKLRAEVTALRLMQKDSNVRNAFTKVSQAMGADQAGVDKLPDELPGESLPWLDLTNKVLTQHKQLYKLLDTPAAKENISMRLERLYKLQRDDGGLSWFEGGKSSPYISAYILAGFGQLKLQGWAPAQNHLTRFRDFIGNLFKYDAKTIIDTKAGSYDLFELYALSYWTDLSDASLNAKAVSELNTAWAYADKFSLSDQALLIVNTCRFVKNDDRLYQKALHQLENIRQQAIADAENGIRWKDVADAEDLETSSEEAIALLDEAFRFSSGYQDIGAGILRWLLTTKQDQHWQTTKATAAAIGILEAQNSNAFGEDQSISGELAGKKLTVSNDLLGGIPDAFVRTTEQPGQIALQQHGSDSKGAVTWYYFTDNSRLDTLNKAIKIYRQYSKYDKEKGWVDLPDSAVLKIGEDIRVKLTIETAAQLKFVHINDPRSAAFEPKENASGYRYGPGLSYYQSVRDKGLDLFAESIPRGISNIEYDLRVAMAGNFASGPVILQCMYQPSKTAYSASDRFVVN